MSAEFHPPMLRNESSPLPSLAVRFAESAVIGDETACFASLREALDGGASMVEIHQDLLSAGMRHVGDWWHGGKITVAGEHMASEITERLLHATAFHFSHGPSNGLQVLLGGGPESWHVLGLRMIGDVLRHRGWHAMYLGPNVPTLSFVETVRVNKPDLVLLSCSATESVRGTVNLLRALQAFRNGHRGAHQFLVGIGGLLAANEGGRFRESGADFISTDMKGFLNGPVHELEQIGGEHGKRTAARSVAP